MTHIYKVGEVVADVSAYPPFYRRRLWHFERINKIEYHNGGQVAVHTGTPVSDPKRLLISDIRPLTEKEQPMPSKRQIERGVRWFSKHGHPYLNKEFREAVRRIFEKGESR